MRTLTCGLEIHAQLQTRAKLFSAASTSFHKDPNSQVAFFDAALPGTQPRFNWTALGLALRAAVALDCKVQPVMSFDRKHYFYGDQPLGYQITQQFRPLAKNGVLNLYKRDGVADTAVRIKQIQIEQDTAKTTAVDGMSRIDLNRANTGLIELVTEPDLTSAEAAGAFVRKLQALLRQLGVCSGELESGAMRVDVNVSVDRGQRCEIKNMSSIGAVTQAIKAEFRRQCAILAANGTVEPETRGWDGVQTTHLRAKEDALDYRYMADPELRPVRVSPALVDRVRASLPRLPDEILLELMGPPFSVPLTDARTVMAVPGLEQYYRQVFEDLQARGSVRPQVASNWIVHRLYGELNTADRAFSADIVAAPRLAELIWMVETGHVTRTSASYLLKHLIAGQQTTSTQQRSIQQMVEDLELERPQGHVDEALAQLCSQVIAEHKTTAELVRSGKKHSSVMFLVGQVMRASQGRVDAQEAKAVLLGLLKVQEEH